MGVVGRRTVQRVDVRIAAWCWRDACQPPMRAQVSERPCRHHQKADFKMRPGLQNGMQTFEFSDNKGNEVRVSKPLRIDKANSLLRAGDLRKGLYPNHSLSKKKKKRYFILFILCNILQYTSGVAHRG